jgi:hypothetical protein
MDLFSADCESFHVYAVFQDFSLLENSPVAGRLVTGVVLINLTVNLVCLIWMVDQVR